MILILILFLLLLGNCNSFLTNISPIIISNTRSKNRLNRQKLNAILVTNLVTPASSPRIQRLKDINVQKQILNDISTSEFALRVEITTEEKKIDYSMLIEKLDRHLKFLNEPSTIRNSIKDYDGLLDRVSKTIDDLKLVQKRLPPKHLDLPLTTSENEIKPDKIKELKESLTILVREDGTVDWDSAKASSKEVAKFGQELWERLNGKEEGIPTISEIFRSVQVKEPITPSIEALSLKLSNSQLTLDNAIKTKESLRNRIRQIRREGLIIDESDLTSLLRLDLRIKELEKWVKLLSLDFDMERICVYLEQEIESSIEPNEQRQFVAEVSLVDKQFNGLVSGLPSTSLPESLHDPFREEFIPDKVDELIALVDDDELNLIVREV